MYSFSPQISEPHKNIGFIWASNIFRKIVAEKSSSLHNVLSMSVMPFSRVISHFIRSVLLVAPPVISDDQWAWLITSSPAVTHPVSRFRFFPCAGRRAFVQNIDDLFSTCPEVFFLSLSVTPRNFKLLCLEIVSTESSSCSSLPNRCLTFSVFSYSERQTDRQRDSETERQRETETERDRERDLSLDIKFNACFLLLWSRWRLACIFRTNAWVRSDSVNAVIFV